MPRLSLIGVLIALASAASGQQIAWKAIQPGVEYASVTAGTMTSGKPGQLHIVRIDPAIAKLTVALSSETGREPLTAGQWCRIAKLSVAINAGMFQADHRANVGYLRHGKHLNNPSWNDYRSAVAIGPRALWLDLDDPTARKRTASYDVVIQNLRLITMNRKNVWAANGRRWSEAALATDSRGRLLFLFTKAPFEMRDFNALLLKLPLDIAGAMHLEGGPEASLSIHTAGIDLDFSGSYETGFWADDSNQKQWPIPNVLGVVNRAP
jgi:hypothetical protein